MTMKMVKEVLASSGRCDCGNPHRRGCAGSQSAIANKVGLTQNVVAYIQTRNKSGLTPKEISRNLNREVL
jgi:hypothetical protein